MLFVSLVAGLILQEPLRASLALPPGRFYVGQGIEAQLVTVAGENRPSVLLPKSGAVDLILLSGPVARTLAATGIGDLVRATNEYRFPVRIVPKRSGTIVIPPLRMEVDGRTGVAASRSITVLPIPSQGRTSAFLGGVGRILATAEVRPDRVGVGDDFEYRIRLDGPGSIGSTAPPISIGLDRLGPGFRVELLASETAIEPPTRTLRFRVRPTAAGDAVIPSFRVSWLDPASGTFMTTASRSVPIRVVAVPDFDPGRMDVPEARSSSRPGFARGWILGCAGLSIAAGALMVVRLRMIRARRTDPWKLAGHLARRLSGIPESERLDAAVNEALIEFFSLVGGRTRGVLTPSEADFWAESVSGEAELGARARRLVAICDRRMYGNEASAAGAENPRAMAMALLVDLGKVAGARKPREAPGTA